jgi:predicted anti-sigma-YlaC factor YlaD
MSRRLASGSVLLLLTLAAPGCIKKMAINGLADSLESAGRVFAEDSDPELVREAIPFALKTTEALLAESPEHKGLLLTACKGFTQYSYAFIETDAELMEETDFRRAEQLRERALNLYLRARDYGLRGLELEHPGISEQLAVDPETAAAAVSRKRIDLLYWTGAAWGGAISLGKDRPGLIADLPAVTAMIRRGLEIDEEFDEGAIHEVMIVLESLGANLGGSVERAREHFHRAVELSGGTRASPYLALATNVSIPAQDREEFENLLARALEIDPDEAVGWRLYNLVVQKRARFLLDHVDDYFLE